MVRWWPVVFLLGSSVAPVEAQPVFRGRVDLVRVAVTVVDAAGDPVTGLSVEDFVVTEDARREMVTYFSSGVASDLDTMPFHLGVLFDASGSMGRDGRFAKTAALRFLRSLDFAEDMTLVDFDSEVRVSRFSQRDFPRLAQRLRGQEAKGLTAFYDALGVYLDGAFDQDGRKVLLLYTDGSDTRSRLRLNELLELVRASDVTIYAIGFQTQNRTADRMMTRRRLEEIVELTGGQAYFPGSLDDLETRCRLDTLGLRVQRPRHGRRLAAGHGDLVRVATRTATLDDPGSGRLFRTLLRGRRGRPAMTSEHADGR